VETPKKERRGGARPGTGGSRPGAGRKTGSKAWYTKEIDRLQGYLENRVEEMSLETDLTKIDPMESMQILAAREMLDVLRKGKRKEKTKLLNTWLPYLFPKQGTRKNIIIRTFGKEESQQAESDPKKIRSSFVLQLPEKAGSAAEATTKEKGISEIDHNPDPIVDATILGESNDSQKEIGPGQS
jgi:hypothetical protein